MRMSVLVPSYKRPQDLVRCLAGLARQKRAADQVVVVARRTDDETNDAGVGDTVRIVETRPISRLKHWRLAEVVERAK